MSDYDFRIQIRCSNLEYFEIGATPFYVNRLHSKFDYLNNNANDNEYFENESDTTQPISIFSFGFILVRGSILKFFLH